MAIDATDVAQAVVDALNDAGNDDKFSEEFSAQRTYTVSDNWADYGAEPTVRVLPNQETNEALNEDEDRFTFSVGIVVIRKVDDTSNDTIDPLLDLPRTIRDFLNKREILTECFNRNTSLMDLYLHDELHQDSCLVSTLRAEYWIDQ